MSEDALDYWRGVDVERELPELEPATRLLGVGMRPTAVDDNGLQPWRRR